MSFEHIPDDPESIKALVIGSELADPQDYQQLEASAFNALKNVTTTVVKERNIESPAGFFSIEVIETQLQQVLTTLSAHSGESSNPFLSVTYNDSYIAGNITMSPDRPPEQNKFLATRLLEDIKTKGLAEPIEASVIDRFIEFAETTDDVQEQGTLTDAHADIVHFVSAAQSLALTRQSAVNKRREITKTLEDGKGIYLAHARYEPLNTRSARPFNLEDPVLDIQISDPDADLIYYYVLGSDGEIDCGAMGHHEAVEGTILSQKRDTDALSRYDPEGQAADEAEWALDGTDISVVASIESALIQLRKELDQEEKDIF